MRRLSSVLLLAIAASAAAQEFKMEPGPKTPADSLKCIKTRPGFKVELMVAEPLVMDPIAFAWGPDGKFWVVEMGDYPLGVDGKNKPGGKIKFLEKSKPDGPYDKMTVFMENVGYPTGVFPYGKGILVTCAPDIFYAELGKDGKVQKECVFTGFKEGNQQHRVNGLSWGIDNWIYGANGDSGGQISCEKKTGLLKREVKPGVVDIRGRDFRFKVETGEFEAVSGQSQFGRCRDDWGNWFGNNNSNPMFHYVLEDRYLKRNPHVLYPDVRVPVSEKPGAAEVFPISKPLPRFNSPQAVNHFTSACSTIIYRDTLFGPDFEGNMFVSEPVHNLIHREIMKPKGVTFTSHRAKDEEKSEFLASSDNWFRPAMIQVGPDGALWIADMYRYVIEHPEWIPKDWQKKLDLRAGHDLGRIYRVYPANKTPREIPRLDKMKPADLAKQLESPSGWVRDTAHQLLFLNNAGAAKVESQKAIRKIALESKVPQARLHAFYAYDAYEKWEQASMLAQIKDPHPAIRKHCLMRMDESTARAHSKSLDDFEKDANDQVRLQLACSICDVEFNHGERLVRLLFSHADDRFTLAAGLSSISDKNWGGVFAEIMNREKIPSPLVGPLMKMAKVYGEPIDSSKLFVRQLKTAAMPTKQRIQHVVEMLDIMEKNELNLIRMLESVGDREIGNTRIALKKTHEEAVAILGNPKATVSERKNAIRLLGRGLADDRADHKLLVSYLTPQTPDEVQAAVIQQIGGQFDPRVPGLLLAPWKSYSPTLRGQVLDTLFARPLWAKMTLDTIASKQIPAQEIDAIRRQRLLLHKDAQIRNAAKAVFAQASDADRGKLVDLYWIQMPEKGDATRGAKLFAKSCAVCHKLGDVGQNVGPDFASIGDKSPQGLLTAILDPNKAVEARYINYLATTRKGLTFNGILSAETSTTITLVANDGKTHQLLRNELEDLSSTGKSMMPDGLEKDLTPQDLADVIAHVRANLPAAKRKEFPGNTPATVAPDKKGVHHLLPSKAAIFGPSIVLEKQYGNLGFWTKPEDHVIWTVDLEKETTFSVWLDFACAPDSAGNTLSIQCGNEKLTYKVQSTGSWDAYQLQSTGGLRIPAGKHEITLRAEGSIRGALLDLKALELRPR